jgi:hypothetical protein
MPNEVMDYPPDGSVDDLSTTCNGDENGFGGPLVKLERAHDQNDNKATRATYAPVPVDQKWIKKELFFFDITNLTPAQIQDIATQQMQQGHALAQFPNSDNADLYLNNVESQVAVYRAQ